VAGYTTGFYYPLTDPRHFGNPTVRSWLVGNNTHHRSRVDPCATLNEKRLTPAPSHSLLRPLVCQRLSVNIPDMRIDRIDVREANALLHGNHYLGRVRFTPTHCLTTPERDAVAVYGPPVAAAFKVSTPGALELLRLWQRDDHPRPLSAFLSATLRWLRKTDPHCPVIVTYADPGHGRTPLRTLAQSGSLTKSRFAKSRRRERH